jgi:hypothetical protein
MKASGMDEVPFGIVLERLERYPQAEQTYERPA